MNKEDDRDDRKKGQQEVQTLTNSYLMIDPNKSNGVLPRLYNYTDYNAFSRPTEDIDVGTGSITQSVSSIPSPIVGKYIHLPDGSVTLPGLAWASETNSGLYKIGSNNFGQSVAGTLVYDWNASRVKLASGISLYLGATAEIFSGGPAKSYLLIDETQEGWMGAIIRNNYTGNQSNCFWASVSDENNLLALRINNSTHTFSDPGLVGTTGAGVLQFGRATAGGLGARALVITNQYTDASSPIIFGTSNTEGMRLSAQTNRLGINTTTPRVKLDVLDTAAAQLRLTYTDNSVYADLHGDSSGRLAINATGKIIRHYYDASNYCDMQITSAGMLDFIPVGNQIRLMKSTSGATNYITSYNTANTSTSAAAVYIGVPASGGDCFINFEIFTVRNWTIGVDASVSGQPLVIASSLVPGTSNIMSATSGGLITWSRSDSATTPTHDLIQSSTGDAAIRFAIGSTNSFAVGSDNSDSDTFKVSYAASGSAVLGTNDYLSITTSGGGTFSQWLNVGASALATAANDFAAGASSSNFIFWDDSLGFFQTCGTGSRQVRLAYTAGSVYSDFQTDSGGVLNITSTGKQLVFFATNAGSYVLFDVQNSDNTNANSNARFRGLVGGASAGDPYVHLVVIGVTDWAFGIDNSDSDRFKIAPSSGLGSGDIFIGTTSGSAAVGTASLATTATNGHLYVPACAGTPTGVPTGITGYIPIVVDSTNNKLYFYSGGAWRDAGP